MVGLEEHRDAIKGGEVVNELQTTLSQASDDSRSLCQNVKKYHKIVYMTFGLTSAILLYGYDNVIVGTVSGMPEFQ